MAFTVRTDQELEEVLDRLTAELGSSRQEIVRLSVLAFAQANVRRELFTKSASESIAKWSELIDRLATT